MTDNCALDPDGSLKDASEIAWVHSPSHEHLQLPETHAGGGSSAMAPGLTVSSDIIFACIFRPFSTQLHFTFLIPPFSLMFIRIMPLSLCLHAVAHEDNLLDI